MFERFTLWLQQTAPTEHTQGVSPILAQQDGSISIMQPPVPTLGQAQEIELSVNFPAVFVPRENGVERVRALFQTTDFGCTSYELYLVELATMLSFNISLVLKGLALRNSILQDVIAKNKVTRFLTPIEATRRISTVTVASIAKQSMRFGFGVATVTGITTLSLACLVAYKDSVHPLDFMLCTGLGCGIYRWRMGIRGMLAGAVIGSCCTRGDMNIVCVFRAPLVATLVPICFVSGHSLTSAYHKARQEYYDWMQERKQRQYELRSVTTEKEKQ